MEAVNIDVSKSYQSPSPDTPFSNEQTPDICELEAARLKLSDWVTMDKSNNTWTCSCNRLCAYFRTFCKCFRSRRYRIATVTIPSPTPLLPPQSPENQGKKTLVLDLDETLIHSSFQPTFDADLLVPVTVDGQDLTVYVLKRPGLEDFLAQAAKMFELVTFTASKADYADPVLDKLDPNGYISHRLFREHCVMIRGEYVKDLSRLGRELANVMILDVSDRQNSPHSYTLNPDNGVPIRSFINDSGDVELPELLNLLREMSAVNDIPNFLMPHRTTLVRRAAFDLFSPTLSAIPHITNS